MIYFVLCPPFHGATLLSVLLNNHSRVLSLGDTNPGTAYDQGCTCGTGVSVCAFWNHVRAGIPYETDQGQPNIFPQSPLFSQNPDMNKALNTAMALIADRITGRGLWFLRRKASERFFITYEMFLSACQSWAPHDVFVDGEKSLLKCMVAISMGFPVGGVIHLTRDPRGYARSYQKDREEKPLSWIGRDWASQHRKISFFSRLFARDNVLRVRYEDLAAQPEETMERLFSFMGLPGEPVVGPPKDMKKHHLIGNIMLKDFDGTIKNEENWRKTYTGDQQAEVLTAAGGLAAKFGYS